MWSVALDMLILVRKLLPWFTVIEGPINLPVVHLRYIVILDQNYKRAASIHFVLRTSVKTVDNHRVNIFLKPRRSITTSSKTALKIYGKDSSKVFTRGTLAFLNFFNSFLMNDGLTLRPSLTYCFYFNKTLWTTFKRFIITIRMTKYLVKNLDRMYTFRAFRKWITPCTSHLAGCFDWRCHFETLLNQADITTQERYLAHTVEERSSYLASL